MSLQFLWILLRRNVYRYKGIRESQLDAEVFLISSLYFIVKVNLVLITDAVLNERTCGIMTLGKQLANWPEDSLTSLFLLVVQLHPPYTRIHSRFRLSSRNPLLLLFYGALQGIHLFFFPLWWDFHLNPKTPLLFHLAGAQLPFIVTRPSILGSYSSLLFTLFSCETRSARTTLWGANIEIHWWQQASSIGLLRLL